MHKVKILYLSHYNRDWGNVEYAKAGDAGFDLRAAIPHKLVLFAGRPQIVPAGIKIALPEHSDPRNFAYELQIRPRSGLAAKSAVTVLNAPGTVDSGYRGEIAVILMLQRQLLPGEPAENRFFEINPGDRIAQGVLSIVPVASFEEVADESDLGVTERGASGFGSTGKA